MLLVSKRYENNYYEKHIFFVWAILFSPIWVPMLLVGFLLVTLLYILGVGIYLTLTYLFDLGNTFYCVLYPTSLSSEIEVPNELPIATSTNSDLISIPVAIATIV